MCSRQISYIDDHGTGRLRALCNEPLKKKTCNAETSSNLQQPRDDMQCREVSSKLGVARCVRRSVVPRSSVSRGPSRGYVTSSGFTSETQTESNGSEHVPTSPSLDPISLRSDEHVDR